MICKMTGTMLAAVLVTGAAMAQGEPPKLTPEQQAEMEAYQKAGTPGPEHAAMAETAGTYSIRCKSWPAPGAPAVEDSGTATRSMDLDGRVMVENVKATMFGAPMMGHGMMGYDNVSKKYWSTWTDSNSTGLMVSQGTCDAKKNCSFTGTFNDPVKKKPAKTRMTTRWTNPTTEVFEMYGPAKDGKEFKMMEIVYTKS